MKICAVQLNSTIGALSENKEKIVKAIALSKSEGFSLVFFPELALTGYPPQDILEDPSFIDAVEKEIQAIAKSTKGIVAIVGLPRRHGLAKETPLYNSAAIIEEGKIAGYADKMLLPNYDVFDEKRYFTPGEKATIWECAGKKIAITICEDLWQEGALSKGLCYERSPLSEIKQAVPDIALNLSASPYSKDKWEKRLKVFSSASHLLNCPVIVCNAVGANDGLIFDGHSFYVDKGTLFGKAKGWKEERLFFDSEHFPKKVEEKRENEEELFSALTLGIQDYFRKSGLQKACLGLSGGIDSALVACLAVSALGKENVTALSMPSRYTSQESMDDAKKLADHLGIELKVLSIEEPFSSYLSLLQPLFEGKKPDVTEENIQARIRGMLLMAYSNKFGSLVLATGNKSEFAMGYSTLYGDLCGGLAPIGDLTKTDVYALCRWINREKEVIPHYTLERAPSAELAFGQKDSDSLPDYGVLDPLIVGYLEEKKNVEEIAAENHLPIDFVASIVKRIDQNEYKRKQSPLILRVSNKSFSAGRRFPIVQKWR